MTPRLFIGMPAWNASRYISEAIESLRAQTFRDWRLVVSDNSSTDNTYEICQAIAARDSRISVVRQTSNVGALANFGHVLDLAKGEFFMWAAADDRWHPTFLATCVKLLDGDSRIGLAFTGVENIDSNGIPVRIYPDLPGLAGHASWLTVSKFLLSPEIAGKANLIYSVFRLGFCKDVFANVGFRDCWGEDMVLVLGAIARGGVGIDRAVLFQKRLRRSESHASSEIEWHSQHGIFPLDRFYEYRAGLVAAVADTQYVLITRILMDFRYQRVQVPMWYRRQRAGLSRLYGEKRVQLARRYRQLLRILGR